MKITRRDFIKTSAIAGAAMAMPLKFGVRSAFAAGNSPQLAKWQWAMRGLLFPDGSGDTNGIPVLSSIADPYFGAGTNFIQFAAGEFTEQLHPALGPTTLWGYYDNNPASGNYQRKRHLGGVMVATRNTPVRTRVTNTLPPKNIIPVDTSVQGYLNTYGENRIAVHLHGGEVPWISDGGPFDWWQPDGTSGLSFFNGPGGVLDNIGGQPMLAGQADFYYPNNQSTRLMWYHDHAHGITRLNAYAGLASGYLIIDAAQDAKLNTLPPLGSTYPLIFQDKKFVDPATIITTDPTWSIVARPDVQSLGSLWYEHIYDPKEFRLLRGKKYLTPPNPSCIPEFFGDTMLTNGFVYPKLTVEAKRYRFFALNANQARFLNLNLLEVSPTSPDVTTDPRTLLPVNYIGPGPQIIQIGSEGGYLLQDVYHPNNRFFNPVTLTGNLLFGPGERADIIIDFTGMEGKEYILYNDAPGPFPVGPGSNDYFLGNRQNKIQPLPGTGPDTRNILRIVVSGATPVPADPQPLPVINPVNNPVDPTFLATPVINGGVVQPLSITNVTNIPAGATLNPVPRDLTLNEAFDLYGRLTQLLGTTTPAPAGGYGLEYLAPATEVIPNKTVEVWRIYNLTADTHPIHFHIANCQVLSRQPFALKQGIFTLTGAARGAEPNELGWKETVQMHPGEVTTVAFYFNLPSVPFAVPTSTRTGGNEYVWHCHILEHEEHDMMRPLVIT
jgi:spore coat protein A, manganese oxidase